MKPINVLAIVSLLFFASCNEKGRDTRNGSKTNNSPGSSATDTSVKGHGGTVMPGSGSGNNASGTSNAGINGTDTAAVGTNHSIGRDSPSKNNKH